MSNYSYDNKFANKNSLPSGDANKAVNADEFHTEFSNIQAAVNSKADSNNSALTGITTIQNASFSGTISDLGTVTTADINGGTIDGTVIGASTAAAGSFTTLSASGDITGTLTGNVTGDLTGTVLTASQPNITSVGTLTGFTSTGIDDNATSTAITIDSNENVGIGTANPLASLEVARIGSSHVIGTVAATDHAGFLAGTTSGGLLVSSGNYMGFWHQLYTSRGTDTGLIERMRIDSSGNVGIGTINPLAKLHVQTVAQSGLQISSAADDFIVERSTDVGMSLGCGSTSTASLFFSSNLASARGYIQYIHSQDSLRFGTVGTERMRIDSSGNLLVGTSTTTYGNGHVFFSSGQLQSRVSDGLVGMFGRGNTNGELFRFLSAANVDVGSIDTSAVGTTYNTSSDVRLKENIVGAPSASTDIDAIQIRSFDWKADGSHQKYGVIAQELYAVAPYAVSKGETEEDTWGVDYSKLVPMMVKEIQELRARVAQLETGV